MAVQRRFFKDRYNANKVWEVAKLVGGYYLRQYVCGRQAGKGVKVGKKYIESIGIFEFEEISNVCQEATV